MDDRRLSSHDADAEDIPTVVITSVVPKNLPTSASINVGVVASVLEFDCFPPIPESSFPEDSFESRLSEDSRRSSATSDTSSGVTSSNASSPRTSLCSGVSFHPTSTSPTSSSQQNQSNYFRRKSSNTLQVPGYAEIGFLHHRNSIESGDRLTLNLLRADFLRRRSLSSLQNQAAQDPSDADQVGQRRFSAPPPIFHPDLKYRRSSSLCRDLKQNFLKLRRSSDLLSVRNKFFPGNRQGTKKPSQIFLSLDFPRIFSRLNISSLGFF